MPTLPAAPARFSITICWPRNSDMPGWMSRAAKSEAPPGANGTIIRMGWLGYLEGSSAAQAGATVPTALAARPARTFRLLTLIVSSTPRNPHFVGLVRARRVSASSAGVKLSRSLLLRIERELDRLPEFGRQVERFCQHQAVVRLGGGCRLGRQAHGDTIEPGLSLFAHRPPQLAQRHVARRIAPQEVH